jgi:coenzyme F420-0:L-glutamate ligase/coenzyme F420-1:gamma-L-glutamate ligase
LLVVAQKIVSKSENRYVRLHDVAPSPAALQLAAATGKDHRVAELIVRESKEVVRQRPGVVVVEHRLGYVHANAGIDRSNIVSDDGQDPRVPLLPTEPDLSARRLREALRQRSGADVAVIINDTAGRARREGHRLCHRLRRHRAREGHGRTPGPVRLPAGAHVHRGRR